MIKIDFEKTDGTYVFRDCLNLPDDHGLTDEQIEALKQERFANWLAVITAPSQEPAPAEGA